jgi:hypothetical protein
MTSRMALSIRNSLGSISRASGKGAFSQIFAQFSTRGGRSRGGRKGTETGIVRAAGPPPPANADPWQPVTDKASGQVYYWNTVTNETTALGAPKPVSLTPQQQQELAMAQAQAQQQPGFMGMMAQGMAFGAGSSMAHHAIGSLFGGGSSSSSSSSNDGGGGGGGGDDDSWDL